MAMLVSGRVDTQVFSGSVQDPMLQTTSIQRFSALPVLRPRAPIHVLTCCCIAAGAWFGEKNACEHLTP